mmetsp:Transcript_17735/g.16967  ORF Transcript_17735/g.16967 Transcript_17735/m.16967 type:complete len:85 (+) Transcript_17735:81-335(+)
MEEQVALHKEILVMLAVRTSFFDAYEFNGSPIKRAFNVYQSLGSSSQTQMMTLRVGLNNVVLKDSYLSSAFDNKNVTFTSIRLE